MIEPGRCVRLVQVGFGNIGMRRTRITASDPRVDLVGVVDVKSEQLHLAREIVGERCCLETDYIRALERLRPDAVIVSTPNALHAPMTWTALSGGAHVLCEKPLAVRAPVAERCVRLARRKGLRLKVGSNHRFWRGVREIFEGIDDGVIGQVTGIDGEVGYRLPDIRSEWYREAEHSGGGTLIDNSPHLLDVVNQILRRSDGDAVQRVRCSTSRDVLGLDVEDVASGEMTTRNGRRITVSATWADGAYRMNLAIRGTKGQMVLSGFDQLQIEDQDGRVTTRRYDDAPPLESWDLDLQAFIDSVVGGGVPYGSGADGLHCVRIIDALYESAASGAAEITL